MTSAFLPSIVIVSIGLMFVIAGDGLFESTYNGSLSQSIDESKQGKLQGVNQSLQSINNMVIPFVSAAIYFYSAAALYGCAVGIVLVAVVFYGRKIA